MCVHVCVHVRVIYASVGVTLQKENCAENGC